MYDLLSHRRVRGCEGSPGARVFAKTEKHGRPFGRVDRAAARPVVGRTQPAAVDDTVYGCRRLTCRGASTAERPRARARWPRAYERAACDLVARARSRTLRGEDSDGKPRGNKTNGSRLRAAHS